MHEPTRPARDDAWQTHGTHDGSASAKERASADGTAARLSGRNDSDASDDILPTDTSPSEMDEREDTDALGRRQSTLSVAETLPWYQEILFVAVICLAQLFTQAGLGQVMSIIHIIGETWGLEDSPDLSWFLAGYSLTVGTFILFSGRLGDMFGYKIMYMIGLCWYSLWSLVCGLSVYSSHVLFVFGRVLQGIGPALILPNALAILGATYAPGKKKSLAFAAFAATAPAGSIIAAAFSGVFALAWWPWTFWCFSLVLAATVVLAYFVIPPVPSSHRENRPSTVRGMLLHLDIPGAITGVTGLVLFNFAWNQAPIVGWQMPYVYVTLILGILFIAVYLVIEMRFSPQPLVPFHALGSDVSFVLAAVACGWGSFGIWVWYTFQFLLELRGESPLLTTASFSPVVVVGALAALVVGLLLHRVGPPIVMTMALLAFTIGNVLMATCPVGQTYWAQTFVSFLVTPFGMDMSFPAATLILSNAVAKEHQGIAASLVNTVVNYSIALGLGFAGTVEYQLNGGGKTREDILKGYRAAYYLAIGIAALGFAVSVVFLTKSRRDSSKVEHSAQEKA